MGIGVAIAVIGALTLLAAASSFLPHILKTPKHTRALGSLQLLAGEYRSQLFSSSSLLFSSLLVSSLSSCIVPLVVILHSTSLASRGVPLTSNQETARSSSRRRFAKSFRKERHLVTYVS